MIKLIPQPGNVVPIVIALVLVLHSIPGLQISYAREKKRTLSLSGPIVSYNGASGGGTYTLLVHRTFMRFRYSEPIPWRGLRRIDDLYLGSVIAAKGYRTRRGYHITSIVIVGYSDSNIRLLWDRIAHHFEALSRHDYNDAFGDYSPELQRSIPFDAFVSQYSCEQFDSHPIIIVQPNPLSRYGIISYGINIVKYSRSTVVVRVELRHFIPRRDESVDYVLKRIGSQWLIASIGRPN